MSFKDFFNEALAEKELFINPKTGKKWRAKDVWERLAFIFDYKTKQGVPAERLWVSFTETPRLNIFPQNANRSGKSTPTGVFGYPMELAIRKKTNLPYFTDRPYLMAFESTVDIFDVGGKHQDDDERKKLDNLAQNNNKENQITSIVEAVMQKMQSVLNYHADLKDTVRKYLDHQVNAKINPTGDYVNKTPQDFLDNEINDMQYYANDDLFRSFRVIHGTKVPGSLTTSVVERPYYPPRLSELGIEFPEALTEKMIQLVPQIKSLMQNNLLPFNKIDYFKRLLTPITKIGNIYNAWKYIALIRNKDKAINFLSIANKMIDKEISANNASLNIDFIPNADKLKEIANKIGLDFDKALKSSFGEYEETGIPGKKNKNLLVYRIAKYLAIQWGEKDKKEKRLKNINWNTRWNKILQYIGFDNAADMQDTGHIHTSEPTQGIFFNPKTIRIIEILPNVRYSDATPKTDKFGGRYISQTAQRITNPHITSTATGKGAEEMPPEEAKAEGLKSKFNTLLSVLRDSYDGYYSKPENIEQLEMKALKMVRMATKLINRYPDNVTVNSYLADSIDRLEGILPKFKSNYAKDKIQQLINQRNGK